MTAPRFRGSNDVSNPDRHAVDSPRVRDAWDLGLLILGTAAAFLLSRAFARLGGWVMNGHGATALLRRFWGVLLAVLIDAGAIALAWVASEAGLATVTTLASILAILVFATLAWIAIASWVDYWLSDNAGSRKGLRWMDRAVCPVRRRPAS